MGRPGAGGLDQRAFHSALLRTGEDRFASPAVADGVELAEHEHLSARVPSEQHVELLVFRADANPSMDAVGTVEPHGGDTPNRREPGVVIALAECAPKAPPRHAVVPGHVGGQAVEDERYVECAPVLLVEQRSGSAGHRDPDLLTFIDPEVALLGLQREDRTVVQSQYRAHAHVVLTDRRSGRIVREYDVQAVTEYTPGMGGETLLGSATEEVLRRLAIRIVQGLERGF